MITGLLSARAPSTAPGTPVYLTGTFLSPGSPVVGWCQLILSPQYPFGLKAYALYFISLMLAECDPPPLRPRHTNLPGIWRVLSVWKPWLLLIEGTWLLSDFWLALLSYSFTLFKDPINCILGSQIWYLQVHKLFPLLGLCSLLFASIHPRI